MEKIRSSIIYVNLEEKEESKMGQEQGKKQEKLQHESVNNDNRFGSENRNSAQSKTNNKEQANQHKNGVGQKHKTHDSTDLKIANHIGRDQELMKRGREW